MDLTRHALEPDPLLFGFGNGDWDLESIIKHPAKVRWTIDKVSDGSGKGQYKLSCFSRSMVPGQEERSEYFVDPEKDFLLTGSRAINGSGQVWLEKEIGLRRLDDGRWFPSEVVETRTNGRVFHLKVIEVQVNCPIDDSEFELGKLEFDPYKSVMKIHPKHGSRPTRMRFVEGQWVPWNLLPETRNLANDGAGTRGAPEVPGGH
jgi:hypothetical protein